jgi:hypothetical protein
MPAPLWQARAGVVGGLPNQAALGEAGPQANLLGPVPSGPGNDIPESISASKRDISGVPFGIEAVNVPLWDNYAA